MGSRHGTLPVEPSCLVDLARLCRRVHPSGLSALLRFQPKPRMCPPPHPRHGKTPCPRRSSARSARVGQRRRGTHPDPGFLLVSSPYGPPEGLPQISRVPLKSFARNEQKFLAAPGKSVVGFAGHAGMTQARSPRSCSCVILGGSPAGEALLIFKPALTCSNPRFAGQNRTRSALLEEERASRFQARTRRRALTTKSAPGGPGRTKCAEKQPPRGEKRAARRNPRVAAGGSKQQLSKATAQ